MLVKFQHIIRNTFLDIAFKLIAPIFQFAQILDHRQSITICTSLKYGIYQDLLINADPFRTCH